MSQADANEALVAILQERLNQRGEKLRVDGRGGPLTRAALDRVMPDVQPLLPASSLPTAKGDQWLVDARSEANIATLLPQVQPLARALVNRAAAAGITVKVTSGTRTYAEQTALYNQPRDGKDNDGDGRIDEVDEKVTNAPAGFSNHNFGLAFDVTVFSDGKPVYESPRYEDLGKIGEALGLFWGGRWAQPNDQPHFELRPAWARSLSESAMISQLRARVADKRQLI